MKVNNQSELRNRRSIWSRLRTLKHSTGMLLEYKGKHKNQWELMPGDLKSGFRTLDDYLDTLLDMYQNWLIEKAVYDPEQAEKFLPKELKRHLVIGKKNSLTQKVHSIV